MLRDNLVIFNGFRTIYLLEAAGRPHNSLFIEPSDLGGIQTDGLEIISKSIKDHNKDTIFKFLLLPLLPGEQRDGHK
jgi:hypothetical protein